MRHEDVRVFRTSTVESFRNMDTGESHPGGTIRYTMRYPYAGAAYGVEFEVVEGFPPGRHLHGYRGGVTICWPNIQDRKMLLGSCPEVADITDATRDFAQAMWGQPTSETFHVPEAKPKSYLRRILDRGGRP